MSDENLYLAHHGIKGQKWGVRKYQNEIRMVITNKKLLEQKFKGNYKKYDKFSKRAESAGEHYKNEVKQQMQLGNDFINALKNVEESGYAWKAKPTLDMDSKRTQNGKNYIKENGRLALKVPYNGATGNKFTVKENASQRKKDIYTSKHMIKPYTPASFM